VILRVHFAEEDMPDQDQVRWKKLVADFETSELTQREFAAERGVSFSNLRNWIYKLRKETRPLVTEAAKVPGQAPERVAAPEGLRLMPVRAVAFAPKARRAAAAAPAVEGLLELALPSGARLRFPAGTAPEYLRALAAAL
jgi:transposase-like protein